MSEVPDEHVFDDDFEELRSLFAPADETAAYSTQYLLLRALPAAHKPWIRQKLDTTADRLKDAEEAVRTVTRELPKETDPGKQSELAVRALTALGTVEASLIDVAATADLNLLEDDADMPAPQRAESVPTPVGLVGGFINKVKAALGKLNAGLMSFLAKYMTFQSWTVSGQMTGGVPWLSGSVTLALTFGP